MKQGQYRYIPKFVFIVIITVCIAIGLVYIHLRLYSYAYDDAYIHFRIANNLVQYGLPYFNPGEVVSGSSSVGWTILLYCIIVFQKVIHTDYGLPLFVAIINALISCCSALTFTYLLYRLVHGARRIVVYVAFFIIYIAATILPSIGLMETPVTLLLVGISFHLLLSKKRVAFLLLAMCVFFRLELSLLYCLVIVFALLRRSFHFREILLFSALGGFPFIVYDLYFFGGILPNTIAAKSILYTIDFKDVIYTIGTYLAPNRSSPELHLDLTWTTQLIKPYLVVLLIVVAAIILYEVVFSYKRHDYLRDVIGIFAIYSVSLAALYVIKRVVVFSWYAPMFVIPLLLVIATRFLESRSTLGMVVLTVLVVPLVCSHIVSLNRVILASVVSPTYYQEFASGARLKRYIQVGKDLSKQYPGATLLTSEIGGLGYGFPGRILDAAGLVSPAAMKYHPMSVPEERSSGLYGAIPAGFVKEMNPDLIVSYDIFAESLIHSDIIQSYQRIEYPVFLPDDMQIAQQKSVWSSQHFYVFIRR